MTSAGNRLRSIERSLDPQETMLLWLAEARQYSSLRELARSLKGKPDGAHPLYRLAEQVEAAVRRRMANEPAEKVERAMRDAVRDVAALWHLFQFVNSAVMTEKRLMWAYMQLLVHTVVDWVRREPGNPDHVVVRVRSYVYELVIWHEVAAAISQRHFQGYDVLLSDYRKELDDLKQFAEDELLRFNDQLDFFVWRKKERRKRGPKLPRPIDWEMLRTEVQQEAARRVSELVDMARAEASDMVGESRRAQAFRERHL